MAGDAQERLLPRGFAGVARGWAALLPQEAPLLRLPQPAATRPAEGGQAAIFVSGLRESDGPLEARCGSLAKLLAEEGRLLLDVANLQSIRVLRQVLEGRRTALEPFGSLDDPEVAVLPRRLFRALQQAGLCIEDCHWVPVPDGEQGSGFAHALGALGWFAPAWLDGPPAARLWVTCRRAPLLAGSVLLGPGSDVARERTRSALERILPEDWEIVACDAGREPQAFDRAVPRTRGELLWFLRAGAVPDLALFEALRARLLHAPAAPGCGAELAHPGDVSGLMLSRIDRVSLGPIPLGWTSDRICYEEFLLRLEAIARAPSGVAGSFATPPPQSGADDADAGRQVLERWRPLLEPAAPPGRSGPEVAPRAVAPRLTPRITLCMIARDEERFLADCLRLAAPAVDEIVVVDTGSRDRTVEIARAHGARVLHQTWVDDFAAPRNVGLAAATGDWILVLDADEMLEEGSAARIRELVRDQRICGWHLRFDNVYSNRRSAGVLMVRLFRKLPGVRYENRIHEQVTPSLQRAGAECGMTLGVADVTVAHYGYTDEIMGSKNKNERNDRLFALHLAERPDDLYMLYKYGDFLRRMPERLPEARARLQQAFDLLDGLPPAQLAGIPYAGEIAALLALELARTDARAEANRIVDQALRRFVPTPNLHYLAASLALHAGQPDRAIAHFERCFEYHGQVMVVPVQEGVDSWVATTGIAQASAQQGDRAKARRLLEQALQQNPDYEVAVLALAGLLAEDGDPARALGLLTQHLAAHPDSPAVCQQTMVILARTGHPEQARRIGEHAAGLLERRGLTTEADRVKSAVASIR